MKKIRKLHDATCEDSGKGGSHSVRWNREINNEMSEFKDKRYLKVRKVLSYLAVIENHTNHPEFTLEFEPGSDTRKVCSLLCEEII